MRWRRAEGIGWMPIRRRLSSLPGARPHPSKPQVNRTGLSIHAKAGVNRPEQQSGAALNVATQLRILFTIRQN